MTPDPAIIRDALDGRTQQWLADRAKVDPTLLNKVLHGHRPLRRDLYERCRRVLPALPPWPTEVTTAA
jgi:hypothetical protein